MKITVYTITDCQFSKQEKEYLKSHNLAFDEKNLETNHEFLTEMLHVSDNFAGTPVTVIEKDTESTGEKNDENKKDKKVVLKGFTAEEFDKALGFAKKEGEEEKKDDKKEEKPKENALEGQKTEQKPEDKQPAVVVVNQPTTVNQQPGQPTPQPAQAPSQSTQQSIQPQQNTQPVPAVQQPTQPAPAPAGQPTMPDLPQQAPVQPTINVDPSMPAVPAPAEEAINDASLDAILKDLQEKAGSTDPAAQQPTQTTQTQTPPPQQGVQPQAAGTPAIPDFS